MRIPAVPMIVSLALVALAATACSSSSKPTTAGGSGAGANATSGANASSGATAAAHAAAPAGGSEIDACKLLSAAQAGSLDGKSYLSTKSQTIATGQDQCSYATTDDSVALQIIVYQPDSGVTWDTMNSVLSGAGAVQSVSGVGDKAIVGDIELDVEDGTHLIAVQGAGGTLTNDTDKAVAVAKAVVSALG